jgi:hypothetical protein
MDIKWDDRDMNVTAVYRRGTPAGMETLKVMSHLAEGEGDGDEIRVIRSVAGAVVDDGIPFFGPGGRQWLKDRHAAWTAAGYQLISSAPGV